MKKTVAILLIAVMTLTLFAACTEEKSPAAQSASPTAQPAAPVTEEPAKPSLTELLIGTWALDDVEGEGEAAEQARTMLSLVEATYTFHADGTMVVTATAFDQTSEESAEYSLEGDLLTVAGDTGRIEIDGDTLKMHLNEGYTVVYKRK